MYSKEHLWEAVRWALRLNFPKDNQGKLNWKILTLKAWASDRDEVELYIASFRGIVLRVGVKDKVSNEKDYFVTTAGKEINKILKE